ncbi:unnamed protein product [Rhizophagus irregularis]|nr:unnamed protein product [Rhizophagus irregularis]
MAGCYGEGKPEYEIIEKAKAENVDDFDYLYVIPHIVHEEIKNLLFNTYQLLVPLTKVQCDKEKAKLISN